MIRSGFVITLIVLASFGVCWGQTPEWVKKYKNMTGLSDEVLDRITAQSPPEKQAEEKQDPNEMPSIEVLSELMEEILQYNAKKDVPLIAYVVVAGRPDLNAASRITTFWQSVLAGLHIPTQKYMVADNEALFIFEDGRLAWRAKDFLVKQQQCESVSIESVVYQGEGALAKGRRQAEL